MPFSPPISTAPMRLMAGVGGAIGAAVKAIRARLRPLRRAEDDDPTDRMRVQVQAGSEIARSRIADWLDVASDWFWESDADDNLVFLSENFTSATGIPVDERAGFRRLDMSPDLDPDNPGWEGHLARMAAREAFRNFVMRVTTPNGVKHLSISGRPYYAADGAFLGYRGTTRDVTAETEAVQALARQGETLSQLIENLPIAISLVGPDGTYLALNRMFLEEFGFDGDTLKVGASFETFVRHVAALGDYGPGDIEALVRARLARLTLRSPEHFEHVRPNGHIIEVKIVPLPAGGFITTRIDVTEARRREQALQAAHARLQQQATELAANAEKLRAANAAKSAFLANMSHELRTPLNAIIGFSEVIRDSLMGPVDARYRDYASDIHASGTHLLQLINDVLEFSRAEAGKLRLREETVELIELLAECHRLLNDQARKRNIDIRIDGPADPLWLYGDRVRIKQILLNLLSNAVKFTPDGGRIAMAAQDTGDGISITVTDTGIGMAPHEIPLALEPFRQVEMTLTRRADGVGLGLPLAKSLAEHHGASLAIASEAGVGTEVTVRFPAARTIAARCGRLYADRTASPD